MVHQRQVLMYVPGNEYDIIKAHCDAVRVPIGTFMLSKFRDCMAYEAMLAMQETEQKNVVS